MGNDWKDLATRQVPPDPVVSMHFSMRETTCHGTSERWVFRQFSRYAKPAGKRPVHDLRIE